MNFQQVLLEHDEVLLAIRLLAIYWLVEQRQQEEFRRLMHRPPDCQSAGLDDLYPDKYWEKRGILLSKFENNRKNVVIRFEF